jgi:hypothetical protein
MTPIVNTHDDDRWPISLDTEAGRVFLTTAEAWELLHALDDARLSVWIQKANKGAINV